MTEIRIQCNVIVRAWEFGELKARREVHNVFLDTGREWLLHQMSYDLTGWVTYAGVPLATGDPEPLGGGPIQRTNLLSGSQATVLGITGGPFGDHLGRIVYTGVGIGGNQQSGPIPPAVVADYPGTNLQTDVDHFSVTGLERPLRIRTDGATPTVLVRWLQGFTQQTFSTAAPSTREVICTYRTIFLDAAGGGGGLSDINDAFLAGGAQYVNVPLSEVGLYLWNPNIDQADTFYTLVPPTPLDYVMGVGVTTPLGCLAYATFPTVDKGVGTTVTVDWELRLV